MPAVEEKLQELLAGARERPSPSAVHRELASWCRRHRHRPPSRGTVYNAIGRVEAPSFDVATLPDHVRVTLHNVGGPRVPGHQIVFAAFNYGSTQAMSYASALPWICLERALEMRGFRPKSLALLRAIASCRGIDASRHGRDRFEAGGAEPQDASSAVPRPAPLGVVGVEPQDA